MGNAQSRKAKKERKRKEEEFRQEHHRYCMCCAECCDGQNPVKPPNIYKGGDLGSDILREKALRIEIQPTTFKISTDPEKPSKYTLKNNQKEKQDIFVDCYSHIFSVRKPTGKEGVHTQFFGQLEPNESFVVEIGLRDPKDLPPFPVKTRLLNCPDAYGYIEIAHYPTWDKELKAVNGPRSYDYADYNYHGRWKEDLEPEKETEYVKEKVKEYDGKIVEVLIEQGDEMDIENKEPKTAKAGKVEEPKKSRIDIRKEDGKRKSQNSRIRV